MGTFEKGRECGRKKDREIRVETGKDYQREESGRECGRKNGREKDGEKRGKSGRERWRKKEKRERAI